MTTPTIPRTIRIHPNDNVAVVVNDGGLPAGTNLPDGPTLVQAVPQGHKVALVDLPQGRAVLRFRCNWFITTDIADSGWDLRDSGWRFLVEGDTPMKVDISFPVAPEDYAAFTPGLTAHRPVNAISVVCAAPAGIRTTADLPQVIARFG